MVAVVGTGVTDQALGWQMLVRTWRVRSKASQSRAPSASSSANHKKSQPYGPIRPLL
eukprot:COSAG01_NODE_247_length_20443_cov_52.339543_9_plen_57_part_00